MPLTPKQDADRKLDKLIAKLTNTRASVATVSAGAAEVLPQLAHEQVTARKAPEGWRWRPNREPDRAGNPENIDKSLRAYAENGKLVVHSDHPGAKPMLYGTKRQRVATLRPVKKGGDRLVMDKKGRLRVHGTKTTYRQSPRGFLPLFRLGLPWRQRLVDEGRKKLVKFYGID